MARARDKSPNFWRGLIALMVLSIFGLFALIAFNAPPAIAEDTACRLDRQDPAHTVMLIDQSDPFNPNDFGWVREFMDVEARRLPKYGRLTVITPNSQSPYDPVYVYAKCSPGSVEDANPILQNPRMIDDTWRERFYEPLRDSVESTLTDSEQPSSPLSEAIYAVLDRADFQPGQKNRRFVIVSDLMQHSDSFSFYRSGADYQGFGETRLAQQIPGMEGVDVVARIVPRQTYDLPMTDVKTFWASYFGDAGATYTSVN
ncbi:MAG: hypothetical protein AAGK23_01380 [Pseudomonadota bacterium]